MNYNNNMVNPDRHSCITSFYSGRTWLHLAMIEALNPHVSAPQEVRVFPSGFPYCMHDSAQLRAYLNVWRHDGGDHC
jgi:hypothetical protein